MTVMELFRPAAGMHLGHRAGWLRAAVLGANDGLVSTSSLMVGVASAARGQDAAAVLTAGLAGLAAGAMAMAAGEWVSVSSQSDVERADLAQERLEHQRDPEGELEELTRIYQDRGLSRLLAEQVACELSRGDAVAAHARDELGHHEHSRARPVQAAVASAASFTVGGLVPMLGLFAPAGPGQLAVIVLVTLAGLAVAGLLGGLAAGARVLAPTLRVVLGGSAAMAITAGVGALVGGTGIG